MTAYVPALLFDHLRDKLTTIRKWHGSVEFGPPVDGPGEERRARPVVRVQDGYSADLELSSDNQYLVDGSTDVQITCSYASTVPGNTYLEHSTDVDELRRWVLAELLTFGARYNRELGIRRCGMREPDAQRTSGAFYDIVVAFRDPVCPEDLADFIDPTIVPTGADLTITTDEEIF